MYFGEGNVDSAVELWEEYADKLPREYISATEDRLRMASSFEPPEGVKIATDSEESEERQHLLERMEELAKRKDERMEILNMLREEHIDAAEALRRLNLMEEHAE